MKTTKIKIRNLFGISETELDGKSIEITGTNGVGKTSVIDAVRYALTNSSNRDYILKKGENEGEILIETDTGLYINRKKRSGQADYKSVKENWKEINSPESFLQKLFTPLQIDPVAFTQMTKNEQNRVILDLIEFDWDLNWIKEKFGEIPENVNYEQNILQVLSDIQSEKGDYFQRRQNINRDMRNKLAFIEDLAKDIPENYDADYWENYDLSGAYKKLAEINAENGKITRAKTFLDGYNGKMRGIEAEKEIAISREEKAINDERTSLLSGIERMKAEIRASEEKLGGLETKLADKKALIESRFSESVAKLDADTRIANEYASKTVADTTELEDEINEADAMKSHISDYRRIVQLRSETDELKKQSDSLTAKIELARTLPGEILQTATIPVEGLTVKDGIPLINGLPVSNLSEGEQLDLCVDVALSKPNSLQIILIDGAEKLSDENRKRLYEKCAGKGLQFIAARTTNDNEMEIKYLC
ncbi:AAA family ATPase [Qingrenia yutianensis]|uniref:Rad50/SbcC-type AAA domain-containing protein n=1 Tax=Qingrenia yutianensis TaxID=2763676 RepID=A0A926INK3_9FIRM|nr:AAA family ATPase [Qingrenia yutianensis]MBC8597222.1 hypothetical protein [Qingrenia yutianensis]